MDSRRLVQADDVLRQLFLQQEIENALVEVDVVVGQHVVGSDGRLVAGHLDKVGKGPAVAKFSALQNGQPFLDFCASRSFSFLKSKVILELTTI